MFVDRVLGGLRVAQREGVPKLQVLEPSMSSWGWKGYSEVWLEGSNDWIYPHLHIMADRMVELANSAPEAQGIMRRALNQAARELLLAQSSDWAFIMKTATMVEYAIKRTKDHIARFDRLYHDINVARVNEQWLAEVIVANLPNIPSLKSKLIEMPCSQTAQAPA